MRLVKHSNRLSREVVGAPLLEIFMVRLEKPHLVKNVPAHTEEVGLDDLKNLFHPKLFCDSMACNLSSFSILHLHSCLSSPMKHILLSKNVIHDEQNVII